MAAGSAGEISEQVYCLLVIGNYSLPKLSENFIPLIEDLTVGGILFRYIMTRAGAALHLIRTWNLYPFCVNTLLPSSLIWLYENFKQ